MMMMMMVVIDYGDSAESKFYLAPFELLLAKVFIIQGLSRIFLPVPCKKVEAQMERDKIYFQPSHHSSSNSNSNSNRRCCTPGRSSRQSTAPRPQGWKSESESESDINITDLVWRQNLGQTNKDLLVLFLSK